MQEFAVFTEESTVLAEFQSESDTCYNDKKNKIWPSYGNIFPPSQITTNRKTFFTTVLEAHYIALHDHVHIIELFGIAYQ